MRTYHTGDVDPIRTQQRQLSRSSSVLSNPNPAMAQKPFRTQANSDFRTQMQNFRTGLQGSLQPLQGIGQNVRTMIQQALAQRQNPGLHLGWQNRPDLGRVQDTVRGIPGQVEGMLPNRPEVPRDRIMKALQSLGNFSL